MTDQPGGPDPRPSRRHPLGGAGAAGALVRALTLGAVWLGLALLAVLVLAPGTPLGQWLSTRLLVAQAVAFPLEAGLGLVGLGLLALLAHRFVPAVRRARGRVAVALPAAVTVALGACLAAFPVGPPWSAGPAAAVGSAGRELRVTVFNSLDTLTAADIQRIVDAADPDVLVLPEASPDRAVEAVAGTGFADGLHAAPDAGFSAGRPRGVAPTLVAVHARAGDYRPSEPVPTTFGAVRLEPASGQGGPAILGVHTAPPVPAFMDEWRADLGRLETADVQATAVPTILAGDLNATLRHGPLAARRGLVDTAPQCSAFPAGTWPAGAPARLRSPIDHVFVTPDIEVLGCSTLEVGASDHLAYAVVLRLPGD